MCCCLHVFQYLHLGSQVQSCGRVVIRVVSQRGFIVYTYFDHYCFGDDRLDIYFWRSTPLVSFALFGSISSTSARLNSLVNKKTFVLRYRQSTHVTFLHRLRGFRDVCVFSLLLAACCLLLAACSVTAKSTTGGAWNTKHQAPSTWAPRTKLPQEALWWCG